ALEPVGDRGGAAALQGLGQRHVPAVGAGQDRAPVPLAGLVADPGVGHRTVPAPPVHLPPPVLVQDSAHPAGVGPRAAPPPPPAEQPPSGPPPPRQSPGGRRLPARRLPARHPLASYLLAASRPRTRSSARATSSDSPGARSLADSPDGRPVTGGSPASITGGIVAPQSRHSTSPRRRTRCTLPHWRHLSRPAGPAGAPL